MKSAFQRRLLPSKTDLVSIVNGRVLIKPSALTASSTDNRFCWPAIATDCCRDVFSYKSTRYDGFRIAGDSPRRTSIHSHSVINETRKSAWLKGFAMIEIGPYRRFYRLHRTPFAGAGDGPIGGALTLSTRLSITMYLSALHPALERSSFLSLTAPPRVPLLPTRSRPRRHQRHAVRNLAA